ncbi:MAG: hypothetical protein M3256_24485 [Actinomycetota bacterium]|nr:hypothetical protein [Actinomycetota bacterium]
MRRVVVSAEPSQRMISWWEAMAPAQPPEPLAGFVIVFYASALPSRRSSRPASLSPVLSAVPGQGAQRERFVDVDVIAASP